MSDSEKKFTLEELKQYDGRNGHPASIAYKGKVYDVTEDPFWIMGDHQGQHQAGRDLSGQMNPAFHGEDRLGLVKVVGVLV